MEIESLKFPVGRFSSPKEITAQQLEEWVGIIEEFPALLKTETYKLSEEQLDTPYRPDGWTIRQVIHHCAESHMNCYVRIKWALTENNPVIKAYDEVLWSELNDNLTMPIQPTLDLLKGLHFRLGYLMRNLSESDLDVLLEIIKNIP